MFDILNNDYFTGDNKVLGEYDEGKCIATSLKSRIALPAASGTKANRYSAHGTLIVIRSLLLEFVLHIASVNFNWHI